jgi:hypothetical protein
MSWKKFSTEFAGISVEGDPSVPKTHWWNILWLLFFGWRQVVVLRAVTLHSFRVGFRDHNGKTMLCSRELVCTRFRVKIGHESCHFFAIDNKNREVKLEEVARVRKNDMRYKHTPMI